MIRICYSDLDGTFLDHLSYSYKLSLSGYSLLLDRNIPLVFVSSKTFVEIEQLEFMLNSRSPFIFENGAGVAFADDSGKYSYKLLSNFNSSKLDLVKESLKQAAKETVFFDEISPEHLAEISGLSLDRARLSLSRIATLPFYINGSSFSFEEIRKIVLPFDMEITKGGRFYHLVPVGCSKGIALKYIDDYYKKKCNDSVVTMGVGDSLNDIPMLEMVDYPFLLFKHDGTCLTDTKYRIIEKPGPAGFSEAIQQFCLDTDTININCESSEEI
ncbi:MAG: HAD-IIB family hydrolase [Spirochaetes bacterium]|nr:HAD-IIB family hydrolase [Spirochaetota bacterium]MBN2771008.1 HAD-IIB family hydrolase [Spirochaetota bacterium]